MVAKVPTGGRGGMILLSTDVNAINVGRARIWVWMLTYWQRLRRTQLVDRAVLKHLRRAGIAMGWSIGPTLHGRYFDPEQRVLYVERSFYVEILDVPFTVLKVIAHDLMRAFRQQEVILRSYDTGEALHIR